MASFSWDKDPKHLGFVFSRYKFVSKMFSGKNKVLEIGASDGWISRIVKQSVTELTVSDFDPEFIKFGKRWMIKNFQKNFLFMI